MSTRSFDQPDRVGQTTWTETSCTGQVTDGIINSIEVVRRGAKSGQNTPNYYSLVKGNGRLPLTAYDRWDYQGHMMPGSMTTTKSCSGGSVWSQTTHGPAYAGPPRLLWNGSSVTLPDVVNPWGGINTDALIIAAMADVLPDLDVLTSAIEARQTVNMVLNARRDAKYLIRTALKGGKHTVKAAADAWLAWRYGWEQLGRDVANCYELLKDPLRNLVLTGQSGSSSTSRREYTNSWDSASTHQDDSWTVTYDSSVRARVIVFWRARTLNAVADPAISLWEIIPFSFVADWFVNVGNCLAAWAVRANADAVYASLGSKLTVKSNGHRVRTGINGWSGSASGETLETYSHLTRRPASVPSLVPSIDVNLTSKRLLDAAALLRKRIL